MAKMLPKFRNLSIEHLWPLTALIGIFIFVNTHPIRPHDFWWHIAAGRELALTGRIPLVDTYSFTAPGMPYPAYQTYWLMEWVLYHVYQFGGAPLVVLFQTALVISAYGLTLRLARQITGSWRNATFATLFAAALGMNDWNVRPQTVTFLLAPLFLNSIFAYRRQARRWLLVIFPIGMLLWVNSHGSFPLGLVLIGLWGIDEAWNALSTRAWKPLLAPGIALGTAIVACLLNPRGPAVFGYIATMTTDPIIQNLVPEWSPPTFSTLSGQLFLGGLLLSAAILALSPKRPSPLQLFTFLVFGALGLRTARGIIWFGLVMAPVLAEHVAQISALAGQHIGKLQLANHKIGGASEPTQATTKTQALLNRVVMAILLLGALSSLPWFKQLWPLSPEKAGVISAETPIAATEFLLQTRPPGPIFHAMPFGSYLIWAAQPEYPVFVDPRIDLYPAEVWLEYLRISAATPGWEERLAHYGVQTLMLSPQEQPGLVTAVQASNRWEEVYRDAVCIILVLKE